MKIIWKLKYLSLKILKIGTYFYLYAKPFLQYLQQKCTLKFILCNYYYFKWRPMGPMLFLKCKYSRRRLCENYFKIKISWNKVLENWHYFYLYAKPFSQHLQQKYAMKIIHCNYCHFKRIPVEFMLLLKYKYSRRRLCEHYFKVKITWIKVLEN